MHGIDTATASLLVGGSAAALARARPLLERSAGRIFHLGPSGAGAAAKLLRNLVMYITLLAVHEGRAISDTAGIDRTLFREILSASGIKIDPRVADAFLNVLKEIVPGAEKAAPAAEPTGSPAR